MASACLSEELECPICLSLLRSPVTTPCGHNFCRGCLQALWEASSSPPLLSCPQCRSPFDARPSALATNSLLCRVLEQMAEEAREPPEGGQRAPMAAAAAEASPPVPCDACLGSPPSEATHSCLTCLASFCAEHLRPHLQSPAFRQHHRLLRPPLRDLPGRTCPEHGRLLDGYCPAPLHAALLCPDCRPRHQGLACPAPLALPQARAQQQLQLKKKLTELDGLNKKALQSLDQVQVQQKQTSGIALQKLDLLKSEFLEMIALIQEVEKECVKKVLAEEKRVLDKYDFVSKVLGKKKNEIQGERDQIEMVLSEDDDIAFLRKSAKLGQMQIKDVFIPKIDLDQRLIQTVFQKVFDLKETLKQYLTHPEEKKTGSSQGKPNLQTVKKNTSLNAPKGGSVPANSSWETSAKEATAATDTKRRSRPAKRSQSPSRKERSSSRSLPRTQSETLETFLNKSREELLEFATKFSLDYNTAHEKVIISEKNTKMSVSDISQNYSYHPHRFTYCSQVVAFQCFKKGIYYWEVEIEHSNFCGIGVCYGSMPRQGVDSRLGRNSSSWCIEWFNARISAWHNDIEECLPNTKVQKIGVLLNCKGGFVIFFGVAEKMTLLHMFQAQFTEALYPAFWIFSSGTTISISQLK